MFCIERLGVFLLRLASLGVACIFVVIEPIIKLTQRNKYRNRKGFSPAQSVLPQLERSLHRRKSQRSAYGHIILTVMTLAIALIWILFY